LNPGLILEMHLPTEIPHLCQRRRISHPISVGRYISRIIPRLKIGKFFFSSGDVNLGDVASLTEMRYLLKELETVKKYH
jgi:hypothetical protein